MEANAILIGLFLNEDLLSFSPCVHNRILADWMGYRQGICKLFELFLIEDLKSVMFILTSLT